MDSARFQNFINTFDYMIPLHWLVIEFKMIVGEICVWDRRDTLRKIIRNRDMKIIKFVALLAFFSWGKFPLAPVGVLAPGSAHA